MDGAAEELKQRLSQQIDAAKRKLELAPIRGEDLVPLINEAYATPPDVIHQVKGLLGDRS